MYKNSLQHWNTVIISVKYDEKTGVILFLIPVHGDVEWSKRELL